MKNKSKNMVKFSRLLYVDFYDYDYVIEFEVNGELKLWYNIKKYQGWITPSYISNVKLSDHCLLQNHDRLSHLFNNSSITHFDIDLPNVVYTKFMFTNCKDLIYFKSKMPNVKDTYKMFYGCSEEFFQKHPHLRDL